MADTHTKEVRSYNMSRIRSKHSVPELKLRKHLWKSGIRGYRLYYKLPGKPDLVFPRRMLAVFIDGCFWHHCPTCFVRPKSNNDYWDAKIERNIRRDIEVTRLLSEQGYQVIRLWEHDVLKKTEYCVSLLARIATATRN